MITGPILETYFSEGAKAAESQLKASIDAGLMSKEVLSARDVANVGVLMLLLRRSHGDLEESHLQQVVTQIEALEMPDGSLIVYKLLLLDLARGCGAKLKFAQKTHAVGGDIDWELMSCLKRATPTFLAKANYLAETQSSVLSKRVASSDLSNSGDDND